MNFIPPSAQKCAVLLVAYRVQSISIPHIDLHVYFGWMHPVACMTTKWVWRDLLSQLRSNVYLLSRVTYYMFRLSFGPSSSESQTRTLKVSCSGSVAGWMGWWFVQLVAALGIGAGSVQDLGKRWELCIKHKWLNCGIMEVIKRWHKPMVFVCILCSTGGGPAACCVSVASMLQKT
jgi:hypothetical protein